MISRLGSVAPRPALSLLKKPFVGPRSVFHPVRAFEQTVLFQNHGKVFSEIM